MPNQPWFYNHKYYEDLHPYLLLAYALHEAPDPNSPIKVFVYSLSKLTIDPEKVKIDSSEFHKTPGGWIDMKAAPVTIKFESKLHIQDAISKGSNAEVFLSGMSLRTMDECCHVDLLPNPSIGDSTLNSFQNQNGKVLMILDDVFNREECFSILNQLETKKFQPLGNRYEVELRKGERLLGIDPKLSKIIWKRVHSFLEAENFDTTPLGFATAGTWELSGVNVAMRANRYEVNDLFSPHKDTQFAPSPNSRSLLSLVIYLNDDFDGGETIFHFPKENILTKDTTLKDEIQAHGGLRSGYEFTKISPKAGRAVIFSHDIIHEGSSVTSGSKVLLRTDVLTERTEYRDFACLDSERGDYLKSIEYFREAERNEMEGQNNIANSFYERSLSLRYAYPRLLHENTDVATLVAKRFVFREYPDLCSDIFDFLSLTQIQTMCMLFPELLPHRSQWEISHFSADFHKCPWIPTWYSSNKSNIIFQFPDKDFVKNNLESCVKVATVYAFSSVASHPKLELYCANFDPVSQTAVAVPREALLTAVFRQEKIYGRMYSVRKQSETIEEDFALSVTREHLATQNCQLLGGNLRAKRIPLQHSNYLCEPYEKEHYDFQTHQEQHEFLGDALERKSCAYSAHNFPYINDTADILFHVNAKDCEMRYHYNVGSEYFDVMDRDSDITFESQNNLIFDFSKMDLKVTDITTERQRQDFPDWKYFGVDTIELERESEPFFFAAGAHICTMDLRYTEYLKGQADVELRRLDNSANDVKCQVEFLDNGRAQMRVNYYGVGLW